LQVNIVQSEEVKTVGVSSTHFSFVVEMINFLIDSYLLIDLNKN